MKKSFDIYKSLNFNQFQIVQKDKEYNNYLNRIKQIVNQKPSIDYSLAQHMQNKKETKKQVNKHKKQEYEAKILQQNNVLLNKIMAVKKRKNKKEQICLPTFNNNCRKKQQQRIERQNENIALRLARNYSSKERNLSLPNKTNGTNEILIRNISNKSIFLKRKLPQLILNNKSINTTQQK